MTKAIRIWTTLVLVLGVLVTSGYSQTAAKEPVAEQPAATRVSGVRIEKMSEAEVRAFLKQQGLSEREIDARLTGATAVPAPATDTPTTGNTAAPQATYYYHDRNFYASCGNGAWLGAYLAPGSAYMGFIAFNGIMYWTGWFSSAGGYYRAYTGPGSYTVGRAVSNAYPNVWGVGCS
jgi:hypothetical protein